MSTTKNTMVSIINSKGVQVASGITSKIAKAKAWRKVEAGYKR